MRRLSRAGVVAAFLTAFGVAVVACGNGEVTTTTAAIPNTAGETTTTSSTVTTAPPATQTVQLAFATGGGDCAAVTLFEREVDAALDPVETAFVLLVAGPTDEEEAQGGGSIFSEESAGTMRSVTLDDGWLVVDFEDFQTLIANASTSCGSMSLLAQLNSTAFQFPEVERVRYEIEGSCDLFSNWLQRECMEYTREGAEPAEA